VPGECGTNLLNPSVPRCPRGSLEQTERFANCADVLITGVGADAPASGSGAGVGQGGSSDGTGGSWLSRSSAAAARRSFDLVGRAGWSGSAALILAFAATLLLAVAGGYGVGRLP
jgi:hypothetical protein